MVIQQRRYPATRRRRASHLFVVTAMSVAVATCVAPPSAPGSGSPAVARAIEVAFPFFEDLRLESLWVDDDCRFIVYGRGAFSVDPDSLLCAVADHPDPQKLDGPADRDIGRVEALLREHGLALEYVAVRFDPAGAVAKDSFFRTSPCVSYHYDPGWKNLPLRENPGDPVATAIDGDWYLLTGC